MIQKLWVCIKPKLGWNSRYVNSFVLVRFGQKTSKASDSAYLQACTGSPLVRHAVLHFLPWLYSTSVVGNVLAWPRGREFRSQPRNSGHTFCSNTVVWIWTKIMPNTLLVLSRLLFALLHISSQLVNQLGVALPHLFCQLLTSTTPHNHSNSTAHWGSS